MVNRRVVVTGIGLVSSLGIGTEANWQALLAGKSGIGTITKFDATEFATQCAGEVEFATQIAGEVKGFDPLRFIEKKDVKKMDVFIQYAVAAAQFAMDDSKLEVTPGNADAVGVYIASGIGGFTTIEREHKALLDGGPLQALVNNAGVSPKAPTKERLGCLNGDIDGWYGVYQLNLFAPLLLARGFADALARGRGSIVNITSMSVRQPIANIVLSNAFRSAVTAAAKTLSAEVAPYGVTANNLAPGSILTDRARQLYADLDAAAREIPARRLGTPEEFGAACAFLCSAQAGYITGQTLGIDGGAVIGVH